MKLISRWAPGLFAVTIAGGAGVAVATFASAQSAPPAPPGAVAPMPPRPPMGHDGFGMHGGPGRHGGHRMMELQRLKTSLKLDASQTALWDQAEALMKPLGDEHEAMKARHARMAAMLDDPGFDPRKLAADMDTAEAEHRARANGVRDAWFALYDSLNPVQRGQAREFLRAHMSRSQAMHERMGGHRPDADGRAPMPPR